MRRIFQVLAGVVVLSLTVIAQPTNEQVADEVIAITKAQWAADMRNDVAAAMNNMADEYTEFNPDYPTRLDGKAISARLAEALASGSANLVAAEMANEKVQVYGEVAILSYNFIGAVKDKEGKIEPLRTKSSLVYVRQGGQWMLVHANFAPADCGR